jgi:hypothetical protein
MDPDYGEWLVRRSAFVAILMTVGVIAMLIVAAILTEANTGKDASSSLFNLGLASFTFVGALILWKRPSNGIGRVFGAVGLLWVSGDMTAQYATYGYVTRPGSVPVPALGAWYGEWYWLVCLLFIFAVIPLLFPTGRPLDPRWRVVTRAVFAFMIVMSVLAMFEDRLEVVGAKQPIHNPFGIPGLHDVETSLGPAFLLGAVACLILGAIAIVVRFRRSRGDERQQLKWFTWAVLALAFVFVAQGILESSTGDRLAEILGLAMALVPSSAAIAILRYRLYDIDLVINRTLVYGALTAMLASAYFGIVVALQNAIPGADDSDLTIAGSTLAVAALFRPLRARVQGFIDRRFYRRKFDTQRTLESFSSRLREDVDLDHLSADLLTVVRDTMQPAHVSLWLRTEGATR